ncbi:hypothetical protein BJ878DRAFT_91281 [Calycina marina]|uniref:N-acetyltransferase domain-containing protein n=1 Tax=Calycina marina TaxID=1763456 RepID=A0A9P8CJC2_9HELO|nr:hypothetical protein BJ878DRAFT_91281 [Calycina marina]
MKDLKAEDIIILLTPVLRPIDEGERPSDPLEALGRSLEQRHSKVRHVPYNLRDGITSYHLTFIKRGQVIILCFAPPAGEPIDLGFADMACAMSDHKPYMIVVCCSSQENHHQIPFPTLIQSNGYSAPALEATASLIFGEHIDPNRVQPREWEIEDWHETRDIRSVWLLWMQCTGDKFSMQPSKLAALLHRPGYAKHYVVRDPRTKVILGFCATYLSYVSREGERLIASIALLLVQTRARGQGIGLSLHTHAVRQLKLTRGVIRLQLGSTFPRLFYGPPCDLSVDEDWFHRRGWIFSRGISGQGQAIYDLVLDFRSWNHVQPDRPVTSFRLCTQEDMAQVLELVESISFAQGKMAWFDQYNTLMASSNVGDIVLAIDEGRIIATALTYTPSCGSKIASHLPWASLIGHDTGGVTCICIPRKLQFVLFAVGEFASLPPLCN